MSLADPPLIYHLESVIPPFGFRHLKTPILADFADEYLLTYLVLTVNNKKDFLNSIITIINLCFTITPLFSTDTTVA